MAALDLTAPYFTNDAEMFDGHDKSPRGRDRCQKKSKEKVRVTYTASCVLAGRIVESERWVNRPSPQSWDTTYVLPTFQTDASTM